MKAAGVGEEGWKALLGGRGGTACLLVGSQKLVKRGDTFIRQSMQVEEADKHPSIQTRVRLVVCHPKITSESDYSVVSHKTVLKTQMFPLFHTFH